MQNADLGMYYFENIRKQALIDIKQDLSNYNKWTLTNTW